MTDLDSTEIVRQSLDVIGGGGDPETGGGCCSLCEAAGDYQLVYCHQGTWHTLAAPEYAATLGFDPVTGFQWVPVLMAKGAVQ